MIVVSAWLTRVPHPIGFRRRTVCLALCLHPSTDRILHAPIHKHNHTFWKTASPECAEMASPSIRPRLFTSERSMACCACVSLRPEGEEERDRRLLLLFSSRRLAAGRAALAAAEGGARSASGRRARAPVARSIGAWLVGGAAAAALAAVTCAPPLLLCVVFTFVCVSVRCLRGETESRGWGGHATGNYLSNESIESVKKGGSSRCV